MANFIWVDVVAIAFAYPAPAGYLSAPLKTVLRIVAARPNYVKVAPTYRAIATRGRLAQRLVHTGQHWKALLVGAVEVQPVGGA